ncbi:hypothetical protein GO755_36585 [Spirosoma sp. HMF4905]|uniref:Uncharacterized protein n=1 Tax=Spirosoma arboris TaxID=2682092 RepID=A0A7K1SP55_9BACT|nr:hypothetical protein [Spirosoma arboris]MVM35592.1 hypothetical protein [Spirosoma arboris]
MRLFCLITMLLLSIVGIAMSQSTGAHLTELGAKWKFSGFSHIEIDLGQRNTLLIGFDRYDQLQARKNVDSVLHLFAADYRKVEDTTQSPTNATHAILRLGETDRALALRYTAQPTAIFRFQDGDKPVEVKIQQDTLQIVWVSSTTQAIPNDFGVYLLVNNLHDIEQVLKQGGINQKLKQALESVQAYKNHDLTNPKMTFSLIQGIDNKAKILHPNSLKSPFLSFHPGIGVGLIRSQWVPSFDLGVQLIPSRFQGIGYGISYTANFFFDQSATDGGFQILRNDFLNAGLTFYRRSKDGRTADFNRPIASFYIGLPVHRSGSYFDSNTIRLGGIVYQNKLLSVQPELYMNGFFKKIYPGLKLVVGF